MFLLLVVACSGCSQSRETLAQAQQEVNQLKSRLDSVQKELEAANKQVATLENELNNERRRAATLETELDQERRKVSGLQSQAASAQGQASQQAGQLVAFRVKVAALGEAFLGVRWRGSGLVVDSVITGSPAQAAGVLAGSTISHVNDRQVLTRNELTAELSKHIPTDIISVTFMYGQQYRNVQLTLGVRPRYSLQ